MPATGGSADSSPSVAQENAATPVVLPHACVWTRMETSMGFLRNRILPQPAGKPSTGGNIYYVHRIQCARSLQFTAI